MTRPLALFALLVLGSAWWFVLASADGGSRTRVHKCCRVDMAMNGTKCVPVDGPGRKFEVPKFVNASGVVEVHQTNKFQIIYERPYCASNDYFVLKPLTDQDHNFLISETGELQSSYTNNTTPNEYCLEQFVDNNYTSTAVVCVRTDTSITTTQTISVSELQSKSVDVGMIISLPFLFSTFLTYAFIKELRSSWHVKFQMCHVATLSLAYMAFFTNKYFAPKISEKNRYCLFLAYTQQYFFIATFFWLNAMCFNIWWTLCELKPINRNKQKEAKKFIKYSFYVWGCSFLISMITYAMDEIFINSNFIRPEFGYGKCWFTGDPAKWVYFYGPIAILLLSDLLMFIHISKILFEKVKNGQEYLKGSENSGSRKYYKQNFILYLKLFIITGGNWLAEIISFATHSDGVVWNIIDIGNALQGVFIFVIFICKKRVLTLLGQKLCSRFKHFNSQTRHTIRSTCHGTINSSNMNENSV